MNKTIMILANSSSGLYDFRKELIEELLKQADVAVSMPAAEKTEEIRALGCTVIDTPIDRRGVNPVKDFALLLWYFRIISSTKPDLLITYTIKPNIYGGMVCRALRIPYAVNITGLGSMFQKKGILRHFISSLYRIALKRAMVVFFENPGNCETMVNEKIVKQDQTCVLNGAGVNLERFSYHALPKEQEDIRFLFIGRVMREKGVEEMFSAIRRLLEDGYRCSLDVLGYYEEDYERKIRQYEREGWLRFHGYQLDVRPFIMQAHCFVLPSYHEGMANTLLECGAMGRPLITSDVHGCLEAVEDGKSGLLCRVQDTESLYQAMKQFMDMPFSEKEAMGKQSNTYIEEHFDRRKVVAQTLQRLLKEKGNQRGPLICLR